MAVLRSSVGNSYLRQKVRLCVRWNGIRASMRGQYEEYLPMSFCSAYALGPEARWPGMGIRGLGASKRYERGFFLVACRGLRPHTLVHKSLEGRNPIAGIVQVRLDARIHALCELPDNIQLVWGSFKIEFGKVILDLRISKVQCAPHMTSIYEKSSVI